MFLSETGSGEEEGARRNGDGEGVGEGKGRRASWSVEREIRTRSRVDEEGARERDG